MANFKTQLFAPGNESKFNYTVSEQFSYYHLTIGGYSSTADEFVNAVALLSITNNTSVALRIRWSKYATILFPGERETIAGDIPVGTTLKICPCVSLCLSTEES